MDLLAAGIVQWGAIRNAEVNPIRVNLKHSRAASLRQNGRCAIPSLLFQYGHGFSPRMPTEGVFGALDSRFGDGRAGREVECLGGGADDWGG